MALKAVEAIHRREASGDITENGSSGTLAMSNREDFSFFNCHEYAQQEKGSYVMQKRFHFLSDNRYELIYYIANILIRCFHVSLYNFHHSFQTYLSSSHVTCLTTANLFVISVIYPYLTLSV